MREENKDEEKYEKAWIKSEDIECQISETCELYGIDKLESRRKANRRKNNDEGDTDSITSVDSGRESIPLQDRVVSQLYISRETQSGQTIWKHPLEHSDAIANHIVAAEKTCCRLPCHSFRILLPPLLDVSPPSQSTTWLRYIMRGILFSAVQSYTAKIPTHLRVPEFIYCWLADTDQATADKDRWAFYHGLKSSANSNPECWLLYNLLDDMQGTDFLLFVARAIKAMQQQVGKSWHHQFGQTGETITSKLELMDAIKQYAYSLDDDSDEAASSCTSSNVYLPTEISKEIAYQLFYSDEGIKSSMFVEEISTKVAEMATDIENSVLWGKNPGLASQDETLATTTTTTTTLSVDFFAFLQVIMKTYLLHKKKTMTLIRLMFDTASAKGGVLTDFYDVQDSSINVLSSNMEQEEHLISVTQLYYILKTVWKSTTLEETTMLYRVAYDALYPPYQWHQSAPDGINFQSFLVAAERYSLFSR